MYTYTYPRIDNEYLRVYVPRPHGFSVYEIVNKIDLGNVNFNAIEKPMECIDTYIYLVEKIGVDSYMVCKALKELLRCSSCKHLGFKDVEAIARQVVILERCINSSIEITKKLGNGMIKAILWQCDSPIIHYGNRFSIRVKIDVEHIKTLMNRVKFIERYRYVFLNFFGYQRFGSRKPITHLLGKLIVKKEWNKFMEVICKSRVRHIPSTPEYKACNIWDSQEDSVAAIRSIPREYLLLYINAYQSYLFNVTLSKLWLKLVELYDFEKALKVLDEEYRHIPIIGSSTYIHQDGIKTVIDEVLEVEGIGCREFRIEDLKLDIKGDLRRSLAQAQNTIVQSNDNEIIISFILDRGCYATVLLRELLRVDPTLYT